MYIWVLLKKCTIQPLFFSILSSSQNATIVSFHCALWHRRVHAPGEISTYNWSAKLWPNSNPSGRHGICFWHQLKLHYNFHKFIQFFCGILNDNIVDFFSQFSHGKILSNIKRVAHAWFLQTMQDNDWDTDEPHPLFQCILPLRCLLIKDSRPEHWAAIQVPTQEYLHDLNYYFSLPICLYRCVDVIIQHIMP